MTKIKKAPAKKIKRAVPIKTKAAVKPARVTVKRKAVKTKSAALHKKVSVAKLIGHAAGRTFKRRTPKPFPFKRAFYMLLAMILGLMVVGIANGFLELIYLKKALEAGIVPMSYPFLGMSYFFPPVAEMFFLISGLSFGASIGLWGWRTVYIEKRHRMFTR